MKLILALIVTVGLTACGSDSKFMSGNDLKDLDPAFAKTPMGQKMISAFDQDNGKAYCVPKMSKDEFVAASQSIALGAMFLDPSALKVKITMEELQADPMRAGMKIAFGGQYPCK
jgi:hypothetical protein